MMAIPQSMQNILPNLVLFQLLLLTVVLIVSTPSMKPSPLIQIHLCSFSTLLAIPKSSVINRIVLRAGRVRSTVDPLLIVLHVVLVLQFQAPNIPAELSLVHLVILVELSLVHHVIPVYLLWMRLTLRDLLAPLVDISEAKPLETTSILQILVSIIKY